MISLNVGIDAEDLIANLVEESGLDLAKFILSMDEEVADEGFTLHLISELTKSLIRDNKEAAEFLASKSLEQTFDPATTKNSDLHRNYSAEWDEQQTLCQTLSQIEKLLNTILENNGML
jgi:hypothetical protein